MSNRFLMITIGSMLILLYFPVLSQSQDLNVAQCFLRNKLSDEFAGQVERIDYEMASYLTTLEETTISEPNCFSTFYTYDSLGRILSRKVDDSRMLWEYDQRGWLASQIIVGGSPPDFKIKYKLGQAGNIIEERIYLDSGELSLRRTYEYLKSSRKIIKKEYASTGKVYKIEYTYDMNGFEIEMQLCEFIGNNWTFKFKGKNEYIYDSKNNWTQKIHYNWVDKFGEQYWEPSELTRRKIYYK